MSSSQLLVRLPSGRTRLLDAPGVSGVAGLLAALETLEGLPPAAVRLVGNGVELTGGVADADAGAARLRRAGSVLDVRLGLNGGGGDQPDWTERGMVSAGTKRRGPDARAPDWHADPAKYAAKVERDKREAGELVVAVGPFCVPCGKRFAKQSVFDAHLSGKKHLAALQRMGRTEEAMVCQLDVEAKRRKQDALDEERRLAALPRQAATEADAAAAEEEARRRAAREEKLRQRDMLAMPSCVTATSVYADGEEEPPPPSASGEGGASSSSSASAAAAAGSDGSDGSDGFGGGGGGGSGAGSSGSSSAPPPPAGKAAAAAAIQAEEERKAAALALHRKMAQPAGDWFNPSLGACASTADAPTGARADEAPTP